MAYTNDVRQRRFEVLVSIMSGDRMAAYVEWKRIYPRSVMMDELELETAYNEPKLKVVMEDGSVRLI